jgi:hypothetical protein
MQELVYIVLTIKKPPFLKMAFIATRLAAKC